MEISLGGYVTTNEKRLLLLLAKDAFKAWASDTVHSMAELQKLEALIEAVEKEPRESI